MNKTMIYTQLNSLDIQEITEKQTKELLQLMHSQEADIWPCPLIGLCAIADQDPVIKKQILTLIENPKDCNHNVITGLSKFAHTDKEIRERFIDLIHSETLPHDTRESILGAFYRKNIPYEEIRTFWLPMIKKYHSLRSLQIVGSYAQEFTDLRDELVSLSKDEELEEDIRSTAIHSLSPFVSDNIEIQQYLLTLLKDPAYFDDAIFALAKTEIPHIKQAILNIYDNLTWRERTWPIADLPVCIMEVLRLIQKFNHSFIDKQRYNHYSSFK